MSLRISRMPESLPRAAGILFTLFIMIICPAPASGDWLQFGGNQQHDNNNQEEKIITKDNASTLVPVFQVSLPGVADGCPVYLSNVSTVKGMRNLLFITTKQGHLISLDARTGEQIWVREYPAGDCRINKGFWHCYTTSSPAVDPNRKFVYTYGLDGYAHKHRVGDGEEIKGEGWPALTSLKPYDEKGSSSLATATDKSGTSYLYVVHAGYPGDRGDYQGHVTAISLSGGRQQVFNADCSNQAKHFAAAPVKPFCSAAQAGIWSRAGVVYDRELDRIFLATGNGPFEPNNYNWGDSVLALNPDGTGLDGKPLDSYTPKTFASLNRHDLDLGSTAPAILPAPPGSRVKHLGLQSGKDSLLRLIDLANMNGHASPGYTGGEVGKVIPAPQKGAVLTAPAVWVNPDDKSGWVFIANKKGTCALEVKADRSGTPYLKLRWKNRQGGTSPL
ncbi:MAG TPA: hypothetical protein VMU10_04265, partial [Desulfomonilia bacterium]|nr:hypothetical protein [Desulfomonilia bacterium]